MTARPSQASLRQYPTDFRQTDPKGTCAGDRIAAGQEFARAFTPIDLD
jgi:hypothetical protein